MTEGVVLALTGFAMITAFLVFIMTKRVSAVVALIVIPIVFALVLGHGIGTGAMMLKGVQQVAPTAALMIFAIFYFGIMIDAGLFLPLVKVIVRWVGDDPLRATLGHAALVTIVSLDGDSTTTLLLTVASLLPIYRRLGMNVMIFAVIGGLCGTILNLMPWGGPSARVAAILKLPSSVLFVPLLPTMAAGLTATFALAWWFGLRERKRLAGRVVGAAEAAPDDEALATAFETDTWALRPRMIWFNVALTAIMMVAITFDLAPILAVFMTGTALALMFNYPKTTDQRARVLKYGGNVLNVAIMVLAAGAFTGVLSGTGMVGAMAQSIVHALPPSWGPHLGLVTAVLASPGAFFLSNEGYYFGVLPVIAHAAEAYGITTDQIGRASLLGLQMHGLSPLVAALYLKMALLNIDLADFQRFAFKYYLPITILMITVAVLSGAVPSGF